MSGGRVKKLFSIIIVGMILGVCVIFWVAYEYYWFRSEQQAKTVLERDYQASVSAYVFTDAPGRFLGEQKFDSRELRNGRLYVPVTDIYLSETTVDSRATKQLASFHELQMLFIEDCHIECDAGFPPADLGRLRYLELRHTPLTDVDFLRISQLRQLESLTLDDNGLAGDWMKHIVVLTNLRELVLNDVDLTGDATNSLPYMTGLTTLQLSHIKKDSNFAPAIARLTGLENLVIGDTPFNDSDMMYLIGLVRLEVLFLGDTEITDDGMASLRPMIKMSRLSLDNTNVGDEGLNHISKLPMLSALDIRHTRATNACLQTLSAMPLLKTVLVEGTQISKSSPGFRGVLREDVWYPEEEMGSVVHTGEEEKGTPIITAFE